MYFELTVFYIIDNIKMSKGVACMQMLHVTRFRQYGRNPRNVL